MGRYVLSVICMALACGILLSLIHGDVSRAVVKLLCGAAMACTLLAPLTGADLILPELLPDGQDGAAIAAQGEKMAGLALRDIIKGNCESYIMDKATSLHEQLEVSVTLSGDASPVPVAAVLTGRVSPYSKSRLEEILQEDLGIPKENVEWIG